MKAQKCPKCGYLHRMILETPNLIQCFCGWKANGCLSPRIVELIDWEYELITNNENLKK